MPSAQGTASFELEPPDEAEMARRHQALLAGGYPYLVAERPARLPVTPMPAPIAPGRPIDGALKNSVYVAPEFHRRGIGRLLLARLVEESEQRGFRQMIAVIGDSAQTPSIALHAAVGFDMIGTLRSVGFKHGRWLDTPLMQRALGPGDTAPP